MSLEPLTPHDDIVLSAMIATVATLWAIGFAAYVFIANYYFTKPQDQQRVRRRALQNLGVYAGYLIMGILALVSIAESFDVFVSGDRAGLPSARFYFLITLGGYALLFSFEIITSIVGAVCNLRNRRA